MLGPAIGGGGALAGLGEASALRLSPRCRAAQEADLNSDGSISTDELRGHLVSTGYTATASDAVFDSLDSPELEVSSPAGLALLTAIHRRAVGSALPARCLLGAWKNGPAQLQLLTQVLAAKSGGGVDVATDGIVALLIVAGIRLRGGALALAPGVLLRPTLSNLDGPVIP